MVHDGSPFADMDDILTLDTYRQLFTKTRENTNSSTSKLHMGYYIASCNHNGIANVHQTMMQLPFHYGFTIDRWLHSLHYMFLKKDKPYIDKLRIIQMIEADSNAALKTLLSHRLTKHTDAM